MALNRPYALGRNVRATASLQTTPGTRPTIVAGDSVIVDSYSVSAEETRTPRTNPRATRSLRELIQGVKTVSGTIVSEHLPRGTDVPPDIGDLLTAGFGQATVTGGVSVNYVCTNAQNVPFLWCEFDNGLGGLTTAELKEALDTAVVAETKIVIDKTEPPMIQFDLLARDLIRTGRGQGSAILAGGETAITMNPTTLSRQFQAGSNIIIGTSVGAGAAGHLVSAVNNTTGILTFAPAVVGAQNPAPAVAPFSLFAEASTGGAPTPAIRVAMQFAAEVGAQFEKSEISIAQNFELIRPVGTQLVADFVPGFRTVSGSVEFTANRTDIQKLLLSRFVNDGTANLSDLIFTFGLSGEFGSILTLNDCNMQWGTIQMPKSESGRFTLNFTAQASNGTAEDEVSWLWRTLP